MLSPGRSTSLPILLAGDAEADLDALRALMESAEERLTLARSVALACAALRRVEYGVVVADVATVEEGFTILRAARRTRPVTPVICLLPAYLDPWGSAASERVHELAFAVRLHPLDADTLQDLVTAALEAPRIIPLAGLPDHAGIEWNQGEEVA